MALATWAVRGFPFLVFASVMILPAYKGLWLGYGPILAGSGLALVLVARWSRLRSRLVAISSPAYWTLALVVPGVIQVGLLLLLRPEPWFDGLFVYRHAVTLLETGRYDPMTYYPPAQAWWYAGWFSVFGSSPLVAQLSQIPLSLLVTWLTVRVGRDVGSDSTARLAGLAVA
ncbi:MAG: hypothetical protein KDL31_11905, partial [Kiritimatiellae bacterium]|nr:hypothetical protein [Kiritimatiellia bacterium]